MRFCEWIGMATTKNMAADPTSSQPVFVHSQFRVKQSISSFLLPFLLGAWEKWEKLSTIHLNIPCHCRWRKHFEERDKTENPFDWHLIRCVYPLSVSYNVEQQKQTRMLCNIMIINYYAFGGTRLVRPSRPFVYESTMGARRPRAIVSLIQCSERTQQKNEKISIK